MVQRPRFADAGEGFGRSIVGRISNSDAEPQPDGLLASLTRMVRNPRLRLTRSGYVS